MHNSNVILSPDESYILTGTSYLKNICNGKLMFFNSKTYEFVKSLDLEDTSINHVNWHPKIN